jgi:hypothetical protein
MHNNHITQSMVAASLLVRSFMVPSVGQRTGNSGSAQNSGLQQTLTGVIRDSICKVQNYPNHHKGVTPFSCTLMCVHEEGASYVLVVDDSVYILDGDRSDLDKFAGGPATVTGHADGNSVSVDSVTAAKK